MVFEVKNHYSSYTSYHCMIDSIAMIIGATIDSRGQYVFPKDTPKEMVNFCCHPYDRMSHDDVGIVVREIAKNSGRVNALRGAWKDYREKVKLSSRLEKPRLADPDEVIEALNRTYKDGGNWVVM